MTPYERMYGVKPNIEFLRTFGCTSYIFIEKQFRKKLDKTAEVGVFLGFSDNSKTYTLQPTNNQRIFWPKAWEETKPKHFENFC